MVCSRVRVEGRGGLTFVREIEVRDCAPVTTHVNNLLIQTGGSRVHTVVSALNPRVVRRSPPLLRPVYPRPLDRRVPTPEVLGVFQGGFLYAGRGRHLLCESLFQLRRNVDLTP